PVRPAGGARSPSDLRKRARRASLDRAGACSLAWPLLPGCGPDCRRRASVPYRTPDSDIVSIIDAPPTPLTTLGPGGHYLALVRYEAYPPVAVLARPHLSLAGHRIDPAIAGRQRTRRLTGLAVIALPEGQERALDLPEGASVSVPSWAPDGRRFVFTVDESDGI